MLFVILTRQPVLKAEVQARICRSRGKGSQDA
jgi:hypothetical protein